MENIYIFLPILISILVTCIYYYFTNDEKSYLVIASIIGLLFFTPIFLLIVTYIIYKISI